jgi:hypothetical protein
MNTKDFPKEIIGQGLRVADTALLTAIFERVAENNPEIARSIIEAAIRHVPPHSARAGEASVETIARDELNNRLQSLLGEIAPPSQLVDGVQRRVMR